MQPGARRRARNNGVIAPGSVWETRMKMDEVKGGIKVFNRQSKCKEDGGGIKVSQRLRRNQSDVSNVEKRKRRNWKPPEPVMTSGVDGKSSIPLRKVRSELSSPSKISNADKDEEEEEEEDDDDEIEIDGELKSFDDKEIDLPSEKPKNVQKENKIHQINEMPILPDNELAIIEFKKTPIEVDEEKIETASESQNKMQNIVDLVMWRDISRSGFVFGLGTFILLSSSYTKDLHFSLVSAISYMGLVYLAIIFLYKSILKRGGVEFDEREEKCIIGEEEAIWVVRFLLPYINEMLLILKALFCGDPETTMKLALLLFAMAKCGSSITLWTLAKLVFFGVFTIPKVLSSYSPLLARYGKFWMERFRDAWESCTHKKAVAAAIFTLIWNLSSTIARIWAVFMLVVAVKLYQQHAGDWIHNNAEEVEEERPEDSKAEEIINR